MELRISISNVFEIANASQNCRGGLFPEIGYSQTGVNFFLYQSTIRHCLFNTTDNDLFY